MQSEFDGFSGRLGGSGWKKSLASFRRKRKENIKIDRKKTGCECVE